MKLRLHNMFEIPPAPNVAGGMVHCGQGLFVVVFLVIIGFAAVSCGKDPVFEQGDYLYENDDLTKVDSVNGIFIRWADSMVISEAQKSVIRNLVANMVRVKGGSFTMGAQSSDIQGENYDAEARDNERPVHEVTVSDYYIGKFEVTQREWRTIMGYGLEWPEEYGRGDDFPAYNVSRTDALRFVEKLSAMTRLSFRLPTEAQWEFAARGGNDSQHYRYSGSNSVDEVAWHKGNSDNVLHPVGGRQSNELSPHDMSGNLWEWCLDAYGPYPSTPQTDPVATSGSQFVLRGGAWTYFPTYCRVTCRDAYNGNGASISNGFRVVMNDE